MSKEWTSQEASIQFVFKDARGNLVFVILWGLEVNREVARDLIEYFIKEGLDQLTIIQVQSILSKHEIHQVITQE